MRIRSLIPWGIEPPRNAFEDLHREIDRLFSESTRGFLPSRWEALEKSFMSPQTDVSEKDNNIIIKAELPGLEEKDLDVQIANNTVTIKGEKKVERDEQKENYHVIERSSGTFMRSIPLPFEVPADKVNASFKNGVLTIDIPKPKEIAGKAKKVKITKD